VSVNHHVSAELAAAGGRATISPLDSTSHSRPSAGSTWLVTLTRALPASPDDVWSWLVQPKRLAAWSPIVPDEPFTHVGERRSKEKPSDEEEIIADVLGVEENHLVKHRWGDSTLTWKVVGLSARETGGTPVTQLTLEQEAPSRDDALDAAAGWDVALAVLATMIRLGADPVHPHRNTEGTPRSQRDEGEKLRRIVGEDALAYGWQDLRDGDAERNPEG